MLSGATNRFRGLGRINWLYNGANYIYDLFHSKTPRPVKKFGALLHRKFTYYWIHFAYFAITSLITAGFVLIFDDISYINALYLTTSSMTCTGLTPVDFSLLSYPTQILCMFLIFIGNFIIMSLPALLFSRFRQGNAEDTTEGERTRRKAMTRLIFIVLIYYFTIIVIFSVINIIYFASWKAKREILEADNVNYVFFSIFETFAGFGNAGLSLLPDSLIPFSNTAYILQMLAVLILLGNTMYPVSIRVIVSCIRFVCKIFQLESLYIYDYILDHPRSCFTHIYSYYRTLWLVGMVIILTGVQIVLTLIIDWNGAALAPYGPVFKIQNAIFQSVSTRNAGFNSLVISNEAFSIQFLYVIMMYISSYPLVISLQKTAEIVRKDKYYTDEHFRLNSKRDKEYVKDGLRRVVYTDLMIVALGILIIAICEDNELNDNPYYSMFSVIFEVVSAYGNVGLSLGYGNAAYSFSGAWAWYSKVVIFFLLLFGRHRGLPANHDVMFGGRIRKSFDR